ncbi:hypothetical protein AB0D14_06285 [Streptomyces sp. NPDC048484]|uniref:hypothetical protein n=1 Tax=Streptomyces sp. NPDC048484 TaxID=3155146 RepID=UPI003434F06F
MSIGLTTLRHRLHAAAMPPGGPVSAVTFALPGARIGGKHGGAGFGPGRGGGGWN